MILCETSVFSASTLPEIQVFKAHRSSGKVKHGPATDAKDQSSFACSQNIEKNAATIKNKHKQLKSGIRIVDIILQD